MKKLILLLVVVLAIPTITQAAGEEYLADINFTRDSVFWGQGTTPAQPNYQLYNNREFSGGFIVHGQFGRWTPSLQIFNIENSAEKFVTSHRMSRSTANQFVFHVYSNIGKIRIQLYNSVNTFDGYLPLQKNTAAVGEAPVWVDFDPKVEFYVPVNGGLTTSFIVESVLNLTGATQLRLAAIRNPNIAATSIPNVQIYSITISKNLGTDVSENMIDATRLNLVGRTLEITNANNNYIASIYNLAGTKIGNVQNGKPFTFNAPGPYIVKIESSAKSIARKIIVI